MAKKLNDEPIKTAFTSYREGRTIIIYKDGGVKIFDQGNEWDTTANVFNIEPYEMRIISKFEQLQKKWDIDSNEMAEIIKAINQ